MSIEMEGPASSPDDTALAEDPARAEVSAPALDRGIFDAFGALIKQAVAAGHAIAAKAAIAPPDLVALLKLDEACPMKELAQRMGCDASFVTSVADNLEKRGFVRREPSVRDRRVKNLVLTEEGQAARERLLAEVAQKMPWAYALNEGERRCFLGLLQKMQGATPPEHNQES
jgi:DNA-binding MarR family transcriptional regulator